MNKKRAFTLTAFIAILFLLPPICARLIYSYYQPHKAVGMNYGQLLQSPLNLRSLGLPAEKKWFLIFTTLSACDKSCLESLSFIARLRLAFGEKKERIQAIGLMGSTLPTFPSSGQLKIFQINKEKLHHWLNENPAMFKKPFLSGFFISDPHGNVILYYPSDVETKALYSDLKHLLNASQIG